ncbi:MAG: hypothetical protein A2143_09885 [Gallionellales bacterium RBG_16_57_15]|nr:MAG: hypothetical protein A2143_09885 [Gallionellales bacterium RBG_16_57_15]
MNRPDNLPHRRSIRLQDYDYSQAGAYFVTICTQGRVCLFGDIKNGAMALNEYGCVVRDEWLKIAGIRTEIQSGEFVVMPNHFHGVVIIVEPATQSGAMTTVGAIHEPLPLRQQRRQMALSKIIGRFKMLTAKRINEIRQLPGIPVWQRNYYEHVIRNEDDYRQIAEYVADNPHRWAEDTLYPDAG